MFYVKQSIEIILKFCSGFNSKNRLIAVVTLLISILMSSVTFWSLTTIQKSSLITDTRFCKDISLLFGEYMQL